MATIRRITVDEAPRVRELYRALTAELARRHPDDKIGISEQGLSNMETQFRVGAVHQDVLTLIVEADGDFVGLGSGEITRSGFLPGVSAEVATWVLEGHEALEAELAEATVAWARDRGAGVIVHYDDPHDHNRDLWESLGFELDVVRFSRYFES